MLGVRAPEFHGVFEVAPPRGEQGEEGDIELLVRTCPRVSGAKGEDSGCAGGGVVRATAQAG